MSCMNCGNMYLEGRNWYNEFCSLRCIDECIGTNYTGFDRNRPRDIWPNKEGAK